MQYNLVIPEIGVVEVTRHSYGTDVWFPVYFDLRSLWYEVHGDYQDDDDKATEWLDNLDRDMYIQAVNYLLGILGSNGHEQIDNVECFYHEVRLGAEMDDLTIECEVMVSWENAHLSIRNGDLDRLKKITGLTK